MSVPEYVIPNAEEFFNRKGEEVIYGGGPYRGKGWLRMDDFNNAPAPVQATSIIYFDEDVNFDYIKFKRNRERNEILKRTGANKYGNRS